MAIGEITTKRWTADEYFRLGEAGLLDSGRSELIEGEIFMMSPQGPRHAVALEIISDTLKMLFGTGYSVRTQSPMNLGVSSAPEPDIAVVKGTAREYVTGHPTSAVLIVEVSDSSLYYDREKKSPLYASAGVPEFWIVNLASNKLEVLRQPSHEDYLDAQVLETTDIVTPLALPGVQIAVSSLLP